MASGPMNQHKRMASGEKITGMKKGGSVKGMPMPAANPASPPDEFWFSGSRYAPPKTGISEPPITKVKRVNGIPGV